MRHLRKHARGVAGFFEEIPAAAVVMVMLILFFSALFAGLKVHAEQLNSSNFASEAETFLVGLEGYKNLTYDDNLGVFEASKVSSITASNITYDFHPPFNYQVLIIDDSQFTQKYNQTVETAKLPTVTAGLTVGLVRDSAPIDIWVPELTFDEYHTAVLQVTIWE